MAEVTIEMEDVQAVLKASPEFTQAVTAQAMARRIDELEAEQGDRQCGSTCDCQCACIESEPLKE